MKSVVCNLFGMAMGVACLALVINRPSEADEKTVAGEQQAVVVVKADGDADVAEALHKALKEKLDGLPEEIQEKIKQKLAAVRESKSAHATEKKEVHVAGEPAKRMVLRLRKDGEAPQAGVLEAKALVVGPEGEAKTIELGGLKLHLMQAAEAAAGAKHLQTLKIVAETKAEAEAKVKEASEKIAQVKKRIAAKVKKLEDESVSAKDDAKTITVTTEACPDGECKVTCIAIAVDDDEMSAKENSKQITITMEGDQIKVDGKAIKLPGLEKLKKGTFKVEVKKDGDDAEPTTQRKMIFMGDDGQVKQFDIDVNAGTDNVIVGRPHVTKEGKATVTTHAWVVASDDEKEGKEIKKEIRWRVAEPKNMQGTFKVIRVAPGEQSAGDHELPFHVAGTAKQNTEVAKRLRGIETELKKIRKLLEQMKGDDDEEEDDD